jgi:hypothetical protein
MEIAMNELHRAHAIDLQIQSVRRARDRMQGKAQSGLSIIDEGLTRLKQRQSILSTGGDQHLTRAQHEALRGAIQHLDSVVSQGSAATKVIDAVKTVIDIDVTKGPRIRKALKDGD